MDFALSQEQRQLQTLARRFAHEEIAPVAARYDQEANFPWPIIEKLHQIGLLNASIPESHGGGGMTMLDEVIVGEELAWGCMGIYTIPMASELGITPVELAGSTEQKERFLRPWLRNQPWPLLLSASPVTVPMPRPCRLGPPVKGTLTGSAATRCGSPMAVTLTGWWFLPAPIPRHVTGG